MIKKGLAVAVILLFIGMCVVPSTAVQELREVSTVSFDGNTLYVGGSGPNNYTTIQDAIDSSIEGDTVFVYNGTYVNVVVYKSINLIGENKYNTIIEANGSLIGINVYAYGNSLSWVNISGFTIRNATDGAGRGINIYNMGFPISNICIFGNIIIQNDDGIINNGLNTKVYNNIISDNHYKGIDVGRNSINISNNVITNNDVGIYLSWYITENNRDIYRNLIQNNKIGIEAYCCKDINIESNNFINNNKNVKLSKSCPLFGILLFYFYKQKWNKNYWDDWIKTNPRPISGNWNIFIDINLFGIPIRIFNADFEYIEYDNNPVIEPYDIGV